MRLAASFPRSLGTGSWFDVGADSGSLQWTHAAFRPASYGSCRRVGVMRGITGSRHLPCMYTGRADPASEPFPGHVRDGAVHGRTASVVTEARSSRAA